MDNPKRRSTMQKKHKSMEDDDDYEEEPDFLKPLSKHSSQVSG